MEYADGGDLFQKITTHKKRKVYIKEKEVWRVTIQMLKGKFQPNFKQLPLFIKRRCCTETLNQLMSSYVKTVGLKLGI